MTYDGKLAGSYRVLVGGVYGIYARLGSVQKSDYLTIRKRIGRFGYGLANRAISSFPPLDQPIFVTGNGRSGTSWIGEGLGYAEGLQYYREPCHPKRNGFSETASDEVWCRYLRPDDRDAFFEFTLGAAFQGHFWSGSGFGLSAYRTRIGTRPRILVKEVASFLSTQWVAARWNPRILMIFRHPGAYVASVRNLDQDAREVARLRLLCSNPALWEDHLDTVSSDHFLKIEDPLEAAAASWAIRTKVALAGLERNSDWNVVFYEDVARAPLDAFRDLYEKLGLTWNEHTAAWIQAKSNSESSGAFTTSRISSQRIDAWRGQLTETEKTRARKTIDLVGVPMYNSDGDWT